MTRTELFDIVGLDESENLEYFEQFAGLMECDGHIRFEDFYEALSKAKSEDLSEFTENYFEELLNALPDDGAEDAYIKLEAVRQSLMLLVNGPEEESGKTAYIKELYRFRSWYAENGSVIYDGKEISPMEALFSLRADKLTGETHETNFAGFAKYRVDELSMNLGSFEKIDATGFEGEEN